MVHASSRCGSYYKCTINMANCSQTHIYNRMIRLGGKKKKEQKKLETNCPPPLREGGYDSSRYPPRPPPSLNPSLSDGGRGLSWRSEDKGGEGGAHMRRQPEGSAPRSSTSFRFASHSSLCVYACVCVRARVCAFVHVRTALATYLLTVCVSARVLACVVCVCLWLIVALRPRKPSFACRRGEQTVPQTENNTQAWEGEYGRRVETRPPTRNKRSLPHQQRHELEGWRGIAPW